MSKYVLLIFSLSLFFQFTKAQHQAITGKVTDAELLIINHVPITI